ncbi:RNA methyltransferase, TrmH family [Lutibacter oricola]|uniref:RNA methyltransferase, TrmH family n=1 Tax=Lutibacter oricola TaxID=762486 RepID=A0A1H3BGP8_9FLAO|nr:RNA methyltransferase [Lutibacter oricola]SDX40965.1 RNA methyltransferase, TrmH family [Lutibacter oricola]
MSLSKNQLKLITSLQQKKYRTRHNLFIVEGTKVVGEFLNSNYKLNSLFCVNDSEYLNINCKTIISEIDLKKISNLKNPNNVLALFEMPAKDQFVEEGLIVVLDEINDPGNLGTIIRLCDWFGVSQLICSTNTVDCFNNKVVQSSMGSLIRTSIKYTSITNYLQTTKLPKFVADMNGENVYKTTLPKNAVLVMGNEANGISKEVFELINNTISIPRFGTIQQTESLNVATATAILLSEFRRSL